MNWKKLLLFAVAAAFLCYNIATDGLQVGNGLIAVFFIFCAGFSTYHDWKEYKAELVRKEERAAKAAEEERKSRASRLTSKERRRLRRKEAREKAEQEQEEKGEDE